jgi:NAD(P)-dependent dehydrogenase (short-subunit alcohol dehydrogenase family)
MRVGLITGGAAGIGAAIAGRLAAEGWRVIIADKNEARGEETARLHERVRFVAADVSSEPAVRDLIDDTSTREKRLDAVICNAGIMVRKPITELALADWNRVLATNLTSTYLLAKAAAAQLREARGAIVTIASTRAHMSEPDTESYAASKGGLLALTHALAVSLGPQVRVNCISPGWIHTRGEELRESDHAQHPVGRVGTVDDVAALAAFLVGDESGFITGSEFIVDGGMTRKMIYAP